MTDAKTVAELVAKLNDHPFWGAKFCQYHPSYCEEAKGADYRQFDTSHDMSAVRGDDRARVGQFKSASYAEWVEQQLNIFPAMEALIAKQAARIAELEEVLNSVETDCGITSNGNMWRFWAQKSKELGHKNSELRGELKKVSKSLNWWSDQLFSDVIRIRPSERETFLADLAAL